MSEIQGDRITDLAERLVAPTMWQVLNTPATATQAIATKAAGAAGIKHVLYGVIASIAAGATAQTPILVQVLDGASVIFTAAVAAAVDGIASINIVGLHIPGTAATSMTLQFSAAGALATQEAVTLIGYDVE